jgi:hypothetical protein
MNCYRVWIKNPTTSDEEVFMGAASLEEATELAVGYAKRKGPQSRIYSIQEIGKLSLL